MKYGQCHKANRPYSGQPKFTLRQLIVKSLLLTICINHVSSFCKLNAYVRYINIFESSCIGSLPPLLSNTPSLKVSPSPRSTVFKYKLINPDFTPPTNSSIRPLHSKPLSTHPNYPTAREKTTGNRTHALETLKLFNLGDAKPPHPASSVPSKETTVKAFALSFPLFFS